eukprot:4738456-Prymnesium_polylepis.1
MRTDSSGTLSMYGLHGRTTRLRLPTSCSGHLCERQRGLSERQRGFAEGPALGLAAGNGLGSLVQDSMQLLCLGVRPAAERLPAPAGVIRDTLVVEAAVPVH